MRTNTEGYKHIKVLLIEDSPGFAELVGVLLTEGRGVQFDLECVKRLSRGIERLGEGNIDVVLLDLSLPDSRGLDTFFKVFSKKPEVPIIVLTATDDEALGVEAVQAGAQDYLIKGQADRNLLVRSIQYAIERHRIQEELRRQSAFKLQASEARFLNILEKNADGIVIVDKKGLVLYVNPAAEVMLGRRAEELVNEQFGHSLVAGKTTELKVVRGGGGIVAAEMRVVETEWGDEIVYLASVRDVTERKQAEETIRQLAYRDALTGLPNRVLFNDRLSLALAHTRRNQKKLAVMLLDLDRFKDINDTLGHSIGDQLLQGVSDRLNGILRKSDTVARMGGDEFLLLLPEIAHEKDATKVAQKVLEIFQEPFVFGGNKLKITTSIGVAIFPTDGEDVDILMKNADIAMYRAKEGGRNNYQLYSPAMNPQGSG